MKKLIPQIVLNHVLLNIVTNNSQTYQIRNFIVNIKQI
jgi:hypothetical protein